MSAIENKFKDLLQELSNGYFAGEDVSEEVKEAWAAGFRYGLKIGLEVGGDKEEE